MSNKWSWDGRGYMDDNGNWYDKSGAYGGYIQESMRGNDDALNDAVRNHYNNKSDSNSDTSSQSQQSSSEIYQSPQFNSFDYPPQGGYIEQEDTGRRTDYIPTPRYTDTDDYPRTPKPRVHRGDPGIFSKTTLWVFVIALIIGMFFTDGRYDYIPGMIASLVKAIPIFIGMRFFVYIINSQNK